MDAISRFEYVFTTTDALHDDPTDQNGLRSSSLDPIDERVHRLFAAASSLTLDLQHKVGDGGDRLLLPRARKRAIGSNRASR